MLTRLIHLASALYRLTSHALSRIHHDARLTTLIQESLRKNLFYICYQPKIDLRTGQVYGVEALLRTRFDKFTNYTILDIIELAERNGQIERLTQFVMMAVKHDLKVLNACAPDLKFSINISAELISQPNYSAKLISYLGDLSHRITCEITETALIKAPETGHENLKQLVEAGFTLSLDDYGVGYSSLEQLQRMPIGELKIDRQFICNIQESNRGPLIVRSTIDMAHAMELTVVAEGVEDATTLALLSIMGCDYVQGYFISRPVPLEELKIFLEEKF